MNTKSLIVLPFLLALAFGKGAPEPTSLNDLRGLVSNNIQSQVRSINDNSSKNGQVVAPISAQSALIKNQKAALFSNVQITKPVQTIQPVKTYQTILPIQNTKKVQLVDQVQPNRVFGASDSVDRRDTRDARQTKEAALVSREQIVKPVETIQPIKVAPQLAVQKAVVYTKPAVIENPLIGKALFRAADTPVEASVKLVQPVPQPIQKTDVLLPVKQSITTIQPTYQTIQPVRSAVSTATPIKSMNVISVQQPILTYERTQPVAVASLSGKSLASSSNNDIKKLSLVSSPASIDYAMPMTNTILGQNNLVSGIQNRVSANNSLVYGHGNVVVDSFGM